MHNLSTFFKSFGTYATASPTMALEQLRTWSSLLEQGGYVDLTPYQKLLDGVDNVWGYTNLAGALSSLFKSLDPNTQQDDRVESVVTFLSSGAKATAFVAERYFGAPAQFVKTFSILGHVVSGVGATGLKSDDCIHQTRMVAAVAYNVLSIASIASYSVPYVFPLQVGVVGVMMGADLITHFMQEFKKEPEKTKPQLNEVDRLIPGMKSLSVTSAIGYAFDNVMGSVKTFTAMTDIAILTDARAYPDLHSCRIDMNMSRRLLSIPLFIADLGGLVSKAEDLIEGYKNWGKTTGSAPPRRIGFPFKRVAVVSEISLSIISAGINIGFSFGRYAQFHILEYASFEVLTIVQNVTGIASKVIGIQLSILKIQKLREKVKGGEIVDVENAYLSVFEAQKASLQIEKEKIEILKKVTAIAINIFNVYILYAAASVRVVFMLRAAITGANFASSIQRGLIHQIESHVKKHTLVLT